MGKNFREIGFTLAEVLITLGIIGIIAAFTIPALLSSYQNQQNITQLKNFYAEFTEGLKNFAEDNGCPNDLVCTGIFDMSGTHFPNDVAAMNKLRPYIKFDKICGGINNGASNNTTDPGCFGYNLSQRPYRELNGNPATNDTASFYELNYNDRLWATLNNGVYIGMLSLNDDYDYGCNSNNEICARIYVDVNGNNKPNQLGRDVFWFWVVQNATLKPFSNSDCASDGVGKGCSMKIIKDSWQMNY